MNADLKEEIETIKKRLDFQEMQIKLLLSLLHKKMFKDKMFVVNNDDDDEEPYHGHSF